MAGHESVNSCAVTVWVSLQGNPAECPVPVSCQSRVYDCSPTTCKVAIGAAPLVTMAPQDVALEMGFVASFFTVLCKKSSNDPQGAGGSLLLKQLFLPSRRVHSPGVENVTRASEPSKPPSVSVDTSTGFEYFTYILSGQNMEIIKQYKFCLFWA